VDAFTMHGVGGFHPGFSERGMRMDGAAKFVKGDAIASIVVILVNLLGGFAVGMLQHGMSLAAAAETYSLLTVGDGLVAQIPALLVSVAAGTVVTRAAEPGEVVTAGTAVVTLLDLNKVYLRGFVPEGEIGKVKVGQAARVYLDSDPRKPVDAYVSRIDPQATFTPENTYFRDDRVKQVVGLKLQLKSGFGFAKPGMPADGEVLVSGDTWPKVRRG